MQNPIKDKLAVEADSQASSRKQDHIDLAFKSRVGNDKIDDRFYYEPILSPHPNGEMTIPFDICARTMQFPIWVSSMTGGTEKAAVINENLAKVCGEFGLGMGLGSCRQLLYEDKRFVEFDVRKHIKDQPLLVNLGIAQIEELLENKETERIDLLISKLEADGLIIHVNPLQEWLQPEGDRIKNSSLESIKSLLGEVNYPVIVKEVGQGFGKESLEELLRLPLEAIDLAGFGGTNFSMLELMRSDQVQYDSYQKVVQLGHTCEEMVGFINTYQAANENLIKTKNIIISGGIKDFLDGYYHMSLCKMPSIYAQASGFLKHATDYNALRNYTKYQIEGLKMAKAFLRVKS